MSKEHSLETTKLPGKKHSIPRCMVEIKDAFLGIKKLGIIEEVGIGRYRKIKTLEGDLRMKTYNENTFQYKIEIDYEGFCQDFYLKVNPEMKLTLEVFLERNFPK